MLVPAPKEGVARPTRMTMPVTATSTMMAKSAELMFAWFPVPSIYG